MNPAQVLTTLMWISTTCRDISNNVQSGSPIFINAVSIVLCCVGFCYSLTDAVCADAILKFFIWCDFYFNVYLCYFFYLVFLFSIHKLVISLRYKLYLFCSIKIVIVTNEFVYLNFWNMWLKSDIIYDKKVNKMYWICYCFASTAFISEKSININTYIFHIYIYIYFMYASIYV